MPQTIEGLSCIAIGEDGDLVLRDLARSLIGDLYLHRSCLQLHGEEVMILLVGLENADQGYARGVPRDAALEELVST